MRYLDAFEGKYGIVLQPDYYAVAVFVVAPKIKFLRDIGTVCFFYADRPALIEDYVTHIRGEIRVHRPQTVREPVPAVVYIIPCRAVYPRLFAAAVSAVVYSVRCCYAAPENISSAEKNGSTRLKLPTVSFKRFKRIPSGFGCFSVIVTAARYRYITAFSRILHRVRKRAYFVSQFLGFRIHLLICRLGNFS